MRIRKIQIFNTRKGKMRARQMGRPLLRLGCCRGTNYCYGPTFISSQSAILQPRNRPQLAILSTSRAFTSETETAKPATREERIRKILQKELSPIELEVIDSSGGCPGGSLNVYVVSKQFEGMPLIKQHRMVNSLLKEEIKDFHAINIATASKPS